MNEAPIIEFENFSFQYFSQAEPTLHDINLKIYPGEKILIVGPSGSGKSTLGHCLNGLIPFYYKGESQGSLKIKGVETHTQDIFGLSKIIGTVLQDSDGQFVGLTVGEDIAFAMENDCVPQGRCMTALPVWLKWWIWIFCSIHLHMSFPAVKSSARLWPG